MLKDLSFAIRTLIGRPAFAAAAIATLAVGFGATTAIFSTVNAALLRPLPYPQSEDIYTLNTALTDGRFSAGLVALSEMDALNTSAPSVVKAALVLRGDATVEIEDVSAQPKSIPIVVNRVTGGFFDLFGVPLLLGELPTADFRQSAVISHRIWQALGNDPDIVGKSLRLPPAQVVVVGVAAPEFDMPPGTDLWMAVPPPAPVSMGAHVFTGYLRAQPGTNRERLAAELAGVMAGVAEAYPDTASGRAYVIHPLVESIIGDLGPILILVLSAAGLLLFLACVNVTNLLLAQGAVRSREIAVRTALGAGRGRIVQQLLTESLLLASLGLAAGVGLAFAGLRLMLYFGAATLPRLDSVPFDETVWLFALAMLVVTVVLIGLMPALRLTRVDIRGLLNESGRTATGGRGARRLLSGLVVAEIAVAITLVAGAGWLVRSYANLSKVEPGFAAQGRLVFDVTLPAQYGSVAMSNWWKSLDEQLRGISSVTGSGATSTLPLLPDRDAAFYVGTNLQADDPNHLPTARQRSAGPGFFRAMGIRLLSGREFTPDDSAGSTAVVNAAFVRAFLQGRDPLIEPFFFGFPSINRRTPFTILGVVDDVKYKSLRDAAEPTFYTLLTRRQQTVVVASSLADPMSIIANVRDIVKSTDPTLTVQPVLMSSFVAQSLARQRVGAILMLLFAAGALGLAAIGIYGVIAYASAERLGEVATRMALGATPGDIFRMMMRQGRSMAVIGMAAGLVTAYLAGRVVSSRLYEVRALDPVVLLVAAALVLAITIVAITLPARRAARADLAATLRS